MKLRILCCVVALVAVGFAARQAVSQNAPAEKTKEKSASSDAKKAKPDMQEMMKRWMEVSTPGEQHAFLKKLEGNWKTKSKMWMEGPGGAAVESTGASRSKMILGGRFLLDEAEGQMLGMSFQGQGLTGYDNFKKKFVGSWADSMGTCLLSMQGTLDESGKVLTMYGLMDEPTTGEHDKMVKYVTRLLDDGTHTFEMYDLDRGADYKVFEITFTRAQ